MKDRELLGSKHCSFNIRMNLDEGDESAILRKVLPFVQDRFISVYLRWLCCLAVRLYVVLLFYFCEGSFTAFTFLTCYAKDSIHL